MHVGGQAMSNRRVSDTHRLAGKQAASERPVGYSTERPPGKQQANDMSVTLTLTSRLAKKQFAGVWVPVTLTLTDRLGGKQRPSKLSGTLTLTSLAA